MKQRRLAVLLSVMLALLALRWWAPSEGNAAPEVAAAIVRPLSRATTPSQVPASGGAGAIPEDLSDGTRGLDTVDPRNAFAVSMPPSPSGSPEPSAPLPAKPLAEPPLSTLPAPPPYQVIGSWQDELGPSVFLAGPRGLQQGRVGDVVGDEYRVALITPQQVLLQHLATHRDVHLAVPPAPSPSHLLPSN